MFVPSPGRRRLPAALAAALVCAVIPSSAAAYDDAGYFAVADRLVTHLDPYWDARTQRYETGPGGTLTETNANLLLVHALAAARDHDGPARADERARAITRLLVGPEIWTEVPPVGARPWLVGPGWRAAPLSPIRHPVFDVDTVDGLVHAYLARDALGLDAALVARIRTEIHAVATSDDYRWPALRVNQFNWYCAMFAADAIVNGRTATLAVGMARHLERFLAGARENFGAGLQFHYLPHQPPGHPVNVDSAEYANIVLSFSRFYGAARAAGMHPPARLGLLRAWVRRAVAGYWTHGGYLNWDTGLGFHRWHQAKKVPLAAQALIGVAATRELQPSPAWGAWAKWLLDRGLEVYAARADRDGALSPPLAFGVHEVPQTPGTAVLAAARHAANALRALEAGLGARIARRPRALFAYDPDIGRVAITTPSYNTAIIAVNQGAFPYGGLDLARLYDGDQEVAANIGGVGDAAFGLTASGVRTQYGARALRPGVEPLHVSRSGAGTFRSLRVSGSVSAHGVTATSSYRFTPTTIDARWTVDAPGARVTFPSWGAGARVYADGRPLGAAEVLARELRIESERSGYRVRLAHPAPVRLIAVAPQSSAPRPGPTVVVRGASVAARIMMDG
jgi:hypothetical protein